MNTYLVIGLGNPGDKYQDNRHNVGFQFLDSLLSDLENTESFKFEKKFNAEVAKGSIGSDKLLLVKPQTYMNESGTSARQIVSFYKVDTANVIVVFDDLDLPFGKSRLRQGGGAGGHNGIKSLISHLGSANFNRLKIGIGRPEKTKQDVSSWVLGNFSKEENKVLENVLSQNKEALEVLIKSGLKEAQNKFN